MPIDVLLMTDVSDLGTEGQMVTVANGYARNYLLPKKLAAPVNEATRRRLEKNRKSREADEKATLQAARRRAETMKALSCTIAVKVAEGEKLYGSVTATDIAEALAQQGVEIEKDLLQLEHPIKDLGVFDIKISLHPEVTATIKVWVVEE
jgi:large subunit ribosomal protein L9